ncbi:MAG: VaFE repeat-containing surface-anchored protein, partial [Clostridiales bacterium]|nr:VaFE repeat-containing surface-anchored protein [Clostridiales bacterium]
FYEVSVIERDGYYEGVIDTGTIETAGLRFGTYFVVETAAPEMYVLSGEVKTVVIDKQDMSEDVTPVEVTFVNELDFKTSLTSEGGSKIVGYGKEIRLTDTVSYTNLVAGRAYTVKGELMLKGEDGKTVSTGITGKADFTPEDNGTGVSVSDGTVRVNGKVQVEFLIDTTSYNGKEIVAYESLFTEGRLIAEHKEPDDEDQTVKIGDLVTSATGSGGVKIIRPVKNTSITDRVEYKNLVPGNQYRIRGELHYASNGKELTDRSGKTVTKEVVFTPEEENGAVNVIFSLNASGLKEGDRIVVFEDCYAVSGEDHVLVCSHRDPANKDQTVTVTDIPKTGDEGISGDAITGLAAAAGMLISIIGICVMLNKRLVDLL